jgi:TerB-C domain
MLTRHIWYRPEFDSLAREQKLMPAGAIDAVNTWAYELFDDPIIIEQGEELRIQSHLVEDQP